MSDRSVIVVAIAGAMIVGAMGACSLSTNGALDGLSQGYPNDPNESSPATDSTGSSQPDTRTTDASSSGNSSSSSSGSSSGGTEAGTAQRYCEAISPKPIHCSDFETNPALQGWTPPNTTENALTTSVNAGALFQQLAAHPNPLASNATHLYAGFAFFPMKPLNLPHWSWGFDVWVDYDLGQPGFAQIAKINFDTTPAAVAYAVRLYINANGGFIDEQGASGPRHDLPTPIPGGAWHRIEIELEVMASQSSNISLRIDNSLVFKQPAFAHTVGYAAKSANNLLSLGFNAVPIPTSGWTLRFDNVVFNAK